MNHQEMRDASDRALMIWLPTQPPGHSVRAIAKEMGWSRRRVESAVARLYASGKVAAHAVGTGRDRAAHYYLKTSTSVG